MDDVKLIRELNKILTLEHGHLGIYRDFLDFEDKEIRRVFRRFSEIEAEHIQKLKNVLENLGAGPSPIMEGGDLIGSLFGISLKGLTSDRRLLETYSLIEKKSYEGYSAFVAELEQDTEPRNNFIAETAASNMLEAQLMHLWLEHKLTQI